MIPWIAASFLVVGFVVLAHLCGMVDRSKDVIVVSRRSLGVIRNADLSDHAKEIALQQDAKQLFRLFLVLSFGAAAALLLPAGVLWLCDWLGLLSLESALYVAVSPTFIIISGIFATVALIWSSKKKPEKKANQYSSSERILHRVAFKSNPAQIAMADIEDRLYAKQLAACKADRPVFITAIPRAGTTLMLECCASVPEFASHCYRDMPFVLIPCLWNSFSAKYRRSCQLQERAHGDGMLIDFDSFEALEEVLWKTFWRRHYQRDRIVPWLNNEKNAEFNDFFRSHMRKIILLRRGDDPAEARYISKNNLNVSRIAVLRRIFPKSTILVPFREPRQHADSLLKQHRNFLRIHKEDPFASLYMRAIGHFDFGENLRPIDFDGWLDQRITQETDTLAFWLEYWAASYKHLLTESTDKVHFVNYDALCANSDQGMRLVAEAIGSRDGDALVASAKRIRPARPRDIDPGPVPTAVTQEVDRVYAWLKETSLHHAP